MSHLQEIEVAKRSGGHRHSLIFSSAQDVVC